MMIVGDAAQPTSTGYVTDDPSALPTLRTIRDRGVLRVLVNSYTARLSFRDSPDAPLRGLEVDLIKNLATSIFSEPDDIDSHIEYVEASNTDKLDLLNDHEVDLILANLTDTPERRKKITMAGHYISMRFLPLLGVDTDDVDEVGDLAGLRVGVEPDTYDEEVLMSVAKDVEVVGVPGGSAAAVALLDSGDIQAYWGETVTDPSRCAEAETDVRLGNLRVGIGHSAVGVAKDHDDMKRFVNDWTAGMIETGRLGRCRRRWSL